MTKPVIEIHPVSMSGIRLYAKCGEIVVSSSTGFLWLNAERYYLITNWHCLTGVNPTSGRYLSNTGARPTSATIAFVTTNSAVKHKVSVDLFDDEGDPLWLVHPTAGEQVDIAALLLPNMDRETVGAELILTSAMNEIAWANVEAVVGDELFVVGHPRNLHQHGLPLWKRATFATEPNLFSDRAGFRQVWIDCATREGMSGSPVVQVKRSMYYRGPMDKSGYEDSPSGYRFYGIYSGRVLDPQQDPRLDDQLVAQIGIVWPRELVERVVASGVRDHFRRDSGFAATVERY